MNNSTISKLHIDLIGSAKTSSDYFCSPSERLLQSAALLPMGEFLGLQVETDDVGKVKASAFYSSNAVVTKEDFDWIFSDYATVERAADIGSSDLSRNDRCVYMLTDARNTPLENIRSYHHSNDLALTDTEFCEIFGTLMRKGTVIQVITGTMREGFSGHGMILLSFPGEMPLRIRSMVSIAFPHTELTEYTDVQENGVTGMNDEDLYYSINRILFAHYSSVYSSVVTDSDKDDDNDELVDLDFSVRTYNVLKRAGIHTVEELRALSREDLRRIHNMGLKSVWEIEEKLETLPGENHASVSPEPSESYMDMLNNLIALGNVKEQVKKILAFAKMRNAMPENDGLSLALNMEFVGNPGTGKTMVARILAGVLYECGILKSPEIAEVGRADLVAEYVGQTAAKVQNAFENAKGRLLFIDEAYSLLDDREGIYGDEAINTIVQEMENHRNDTVVVFAGYPDRMKEFISRNPGLRSRVPFSICFQDYSAEELVRIARLEAKKKGFSISTDAGKKILAICREAPENPKNGNGRFCRNLVEDAVMNFALRTYGSDEISEKPEFVLSEVDFNRPKVDMEERKKALGFLA